MNVDWIARSKFKNKIRTWFHDCGYLEIDTPCLVDLPGTEPYLDYFQTDWLDYRDQATSKYLRSSPEIHMKRILAETKHSKIFQIAPVFRNKNEYGDWHHPEFTMLEWYHVGVGYENFQSECESLLSSVTGRFQNFTRISVAEAFEKWVGFSLYDQDPEIAAKALHSGFQFVNEHDDFENSFFKLLINIIEPQLKLVGAVTLFDYPASQAALAEIESKTAKRFEIYLNGVEVLNAFLELRGSQANYDRLELDNTRRKQGGRQPLAIDHSFVDAMDIIPKGTCGAALGFDRLLALHCGQTSIDSVIPFRENWR